MSKNLKKHWSARYYEEGDEIIIGNYIYKVRVKNVKEVIVDQHSERLYILEYISTKQERMSLEIESLKDRVKLLEHEADDALIKEIKRETNSIFGAPTKTTNVIPNSVVSRDDLKMERELFTSLSDRIRFIEMRIDDIESNTNVGNKYPKGVKTIINDDNKTYFGYCSNCAGEIIASHNKLLVSNHILKHNYCFHCGIEFSDKVKDNSNCKNNNSTAVKSNG